MANRGAGESYNSQSAQVAGSVPSTRSRANQHVSKPVPAGQAARRSSSQLRKTQQGSLLSTASTGIEVSVGSATGWGLSLASDRATQRFIK
jgi:hypothetical protein